MVNNSPLSPANEVHDLHLVARVDQGLAVAIALDDPQVVLHRNAAWIDAELCEQRADGDRAGELVRVAVQADRQSLPRYFTGGLRPAGPPYSLTRSPLRRLADDSELRRTRGAAARRYWMREHSPEAMLSDYLRLMEAARSRPAPRPPLPPHLVDGGMRQLETLIEPFGLSSPFVTRSERA